MESPLILLSLAFSVLAVVVTAVLGLRTVPSRLLKHVNELDLTVYDCKKMVERFNAESLERKATQDGFEERCAELLEAATSKQRRAAASASRAARANGQVQEHVPSNDSPPPSSDEEAALAWARRRAGLA